RCLRSSNVRGGVEHQPGLDRHSGAVRGGRPPSTAELRVPLALHGGHLRAAGGHLSVSGSASLDVHSGPLEWIDVRWGSVVRNCSPAMEPGASDRSFADRMVCGGRSLFPVAERKPRNSYTSLAKDCSHILSPDADRDHPPTYSRTIVGHHLE